MAFGLPTEDDGRRDDPLLSEHSLAVGAYRPDVETLTAASNRIVIGVGEESANTITGRGATGTAALLGLDATVFPSHHGEFVGGEPPYGGKPDEFAVVLRTVLSSG